MKTLIIAITLLSISILSFAQDSLYIYHTGGYVEAKSISSIDSIKFNSKRDSLYFHQGKTIKKYEYAYIDSISFVRVNTIKSTKKDRGVVINGMCFSTRNVNSNGTFVDNITDYGYLYSWGSNTGYSPTSTTYVPNDFDYTGGYTTPTANDTWISANDPSPAGWRVPTYDEIDNCLFSNNITNAVTTINGIMGMLFTDNTTKQTIFFPNAGYRRTYYREGSGFGYYWSASAATNYVSDVKSIYARANYLYTGGDGIHAIVMSKEITTRNIAYSIRSVIR